MSRLGIGPIPNRPRTDLSTHRADRPESEYITNNCKSYGKSFRDVAGKVPRNIGEDGLPFIFLGGAEGNVREPCIVVSIKSVFLQDSLLSAW